MRRLRYDRLVGGLARKSLVLFALALAGCAREPAWQRLPPQFAMPSGPEPAPEPLPFARLLVNMSDADVERHIVAGVMNAEAGAPSRWTTERARLRFEIEDPARLGVYLHFFIPGDTFKTTGPQTLQVQLNGHALGSARYTAPGDYEFRGRVPEGVLRSGASELSFDIAPAYAAPTDGARYGVVLFAAGFERR